MSSSQKNTESRFSRFLASKGFYVAIALCLIGASVSAFIAIDRTLDGLYDIGDIPEINNPYVPDTTNPVDTPKSGVPVESDAGDEVDGTQPAVPKEGDVVVPEEVIAKKVTYKMPVQGTVINNFSGGELVKNKTLGDWRTHDGIDIKADVGTEVKTAAAGTVLAVYEDVMWGTCIEIEHADKAVTYYYSLAREVRVKAGDKIADGAVIGTLDETAISEIADPCHLHFGIKKNGEWIDPLSLISKG